MHASSRHVHETRRLHVGPPTSEFTIMDGTTKEGRGHAAQVTRRTKTVRIFNQVQNQYRPTLAALDRAIDQVEADAKRPPPLPPPPKEVRIKVDDLNVECPRAWPPSSSDDVDKLFAYLMPDIGLRFWHDARLTSFAAMPTSANELRVEIAHSTECNTQDAFESHVDDAVEESIGREESAEMTKVGPLRLLRCGP